MKRKILGIAAALITAAAATITASAEYYIGTEQDGNTVKVEVIATGATLPAIEFTVEMPDTLTAVIVAEDTEIEDEEIIEDTDDTSDNGTVSTDDETDIAVDTDASETDGDISGGTDNDSDENPETGITVSVATVAALAGAAVIVARER